VPSPSDTAAADWICTLTGAELCDRQSLQPITFRLCGHNGSMHVRGAHARYWLPLSWFGGGNVRIQPGAVTRVADIERLLPVATYPSLCAVQGPVMAELSRGSSATADLQACRSGGQQSGRLRSFTAPCSVAQRRISGSGPQEKFALL